MSNNWDRPPLLSYYAPRRCHSRSMDEIRDEELILEAELRDERDAKAREVEDELKQIREEMGKDE